MLLNTLALFQVGFRRLLLYTRACAWQLFFLATTISASCISKTCVFECSSQLWFGKHVSDHDPALIPPFFYFP